MKRYFFTLILSLLIVDAGRANAPRSGSLKQIFDAYIDIKNALVNNDGTTAKFKANDLYHLLSSNPDKGLSTKQRRILADNIQPLLDNSRLISETISENDQRQYFAALSTALFTLLTDLKIYPGIIYRQYCPVNKGYWLSETSTVKNPYYNYSDKEMTHCGKTVAVLRGH